VLSKFIHEYFRFGATKCVNPCLFTVFLCIPVFEAIAFIDHKTIKRKKIMKKTADTKFAIIEPIKERWSTRAFSAKSVEQEKLQRIFEAARWASSGFNEQPWRFMVGTDKDETYMRIFESLIEFNQLWAASAPVLILSCGKKFLTQNPEQPNASFQYDVGQAVANMAIQATHEGLFMHQMGGFDAKLLSELFLIPFDFEPLTVIALGYAGEAENLHPNLRKLETAARERKDFDEFVFNTAFGRKTKLFK